MDTLTVLALVAAGCYVVACACWPWVRCRWCGGTGKWRSPTRKAWRACARCGGEGDHIRAGRRLWDAIRGKH